MKRSVKILICYHKPDVLLKDNILTPIHVGRALARQRGETEEFRWMCENMIGDDTGDNISAKNASYNELTALYWAWKNYSALGSPDYIGLMHYRRHFIFRKSDRVVEEVDGIDDTYFSRINYSESTVEQLFDSCDFVAHMGHVGNIYEHYKQNHHVEDLDRALKIMAELYPRYRGSAARFLRSSYGNFCNMFIFPKEVFFDYCEWLFNILFRFEREVDLTDKRLFISERLTGIYIEQLRRDGLHQKSLSATFVRAPARLPAAVPYRPGAEFQTAAAMVSLLDSAPRDAQIDFYILHRAGEGERAERAFSPVARRNNCNIRYIDADQVFARKGLRADELDLPRQYPLAVADALETESKALFFDERIIFFGDAISLYQLCNTDEFAAICLPPRGGRCDESLFVLNCARLRKKGALDNIGAEDAALPSEQIFARAVSDRVGRIPPTFYTQAPAFGGIAERRGMFLHYGEDCLPWEDVVAPLSADWWRAAEKVPAGVPFGVGRTAARQVRARTDEVCARLGKRLPEIVGQARAAGLPQEANGFMAKGMRYLREHGVWLTAKKTISVLIGKANGKK